MKLPAFVLACLPPAVVLFWILFLAAAIWARIPAQPQPPIYDAYSYYWKAHEFWSAMHDGRFFNPLNVEPAFRPPGTVLMSYPFGFDRDPRGFYFRSIFLPAALMAISALVAAYRISRPVAVSWQASIAAMLCSTPSLFYRFDLGPQNPFIAYWGLVDGFLSGVAALSAACAWQCAKTKSMHWAVATAITSAFCVLIKPSGVLVAMLVGIAWFTLAVAQMAEEGSGSLAQRGPLLRHLSNGLIIAGTDVLVLVAARFSAYLSESNLGSSTALIAIMKADLSVPLAELFPLIYFGPGICFLLILLLGVVITVAGLLRGRDTDPTRRLALLGTLCALASVGLGMWFWLFWSGGQSQVRYAMPFLAIAMIWTLPAITAFSSLAPRSLTIGANLLMLVIPLNLGLLLLQSHPDREWQRLSGVVLDLAPPFAPMADFRRFIDEPRTKPTIVYSFNTDTADQILHSLAEQRMLFNRESAPVLFQRPVDWQRPTTFRIEEILASDLLLFKPRPSPLASTPLRTLQDEIWTFPLRSLQEEIWTFQWWATGLTPQDGVETLMDFPSARLLRITDRAKLRQSLERMIADHAWRPAFYRANSRAP